MFQLAKSGTLVGLLRFSPPSLFACAASNQANLAFKTTIIEDTHITLAGISFKVEANNTVAITNIREKNCRVFVPVRIYNFLNQSTWASRILYSATLTLLSSPVCYLQVLRSCLSWTTLLARFYLYWVLNSSSLSLNVQCWSRGSWLGPRAITG